MPIIATSVKSVKKIIEGAGYLFKVGDRVEGDDKEKGVIFSGTVFHVSGSNVSVKRDDGRVGSGENGTWLVHGARQGDDLDYNLRLIVHEKPEKKVKANKTNTIYAQLSRRKNGRTYFTFSLPERITAMYKDRCADVKISKSWTGLSFYTIPDLISDEKYKAKLKSYNLFDDYGDGFVKLEAGNYKLNIAWIRTVGGSGEFEVKNEIGHGELNLLMENMLTFLKNHFEDFYRSFTIKGSLTIDF